MGLLAGLLCLAFMGTTLARYSNQITIRNPFSTAVSSAVLLEHYTPESVFLPGETIQKEPWFRNTGEVDLVLRLKVEETWLSEAQRPIDLEVSAVKKDWSDSFERDWVKIGPWYYYCPILRKAGESGCQTPIILEKLSLSKDCSNDSHGPDYSGQIYQLKLQAEAVQADQLSINTEWNLSGEEAGTERLQWKGLLKQAY